VNVSGVRAEKCPEDPGPSRRNRFPRSARLLKRSDFESVYKRGKRFFAANLTLFYFFREDRATARIGFTVGRVLGGAVARNRIKRRLREAVRLHRAELNNAVDIVVNPKKSARTIEFSELEQDILRGFQAVQKAAEKARDL